MTWARSYVCGLRTAALITATGVAMVLMLGGLVRFSGEEEASAGRVPNPDLRFGAPFDDLFAGARERPARDARARGARDSRDAGRPRDERSGRAEGERRPGSRRGAVGDGISDAGAGETSPGPRPGGTGPSSAPAPANPLPQIGEVAPPAFADPGGVVDTVTGALPPVAAPVPSPLPQLPVPNAAPATPG